MNGSYGRWIWRNHRQRGRPIGGHHELGIRASSSSSHRTNREHTIELIELVEEPCSGCARRTDGGPPRSAPSGCPPGAPDSESLDTLSAPCFQSRGSAFEKIRGPCRLSAHAALRGSLPPERRSRRPPIRLRTHHRQQLDAGAVRSLRLKIPTSEAGSRSPDSSPPARVVQTPDRRVRPDLSDGVDR